MTLSSPHPGRLGQMPRRLDAPHRPASPARVALAEWWRAFSGTARRVWCLPELGGCEEELVDTRRARKRGTVPR